jgi:hypothetical protein
MIHWTPREELKRIIGDGLELALLEQRSYVVGKDSFIARGDGKILTKNCFLKEETKQGEGHISYETACWDFNSEGNFRERKVMTPNSLRSKSSYVPRGKYSEQDIQGIESFYIETDINQIKAYLSNRYGNPKEIKKIERLFGI